MIRPDTTKYRLLEMIGMCGEFPADQLNRLIPSASYAEKLITDLKAEHLIRTHYRDALRGYRLTKAAKEMLLSVSPLRFQCYLTGNTETNLIRSEVSRRIRLHQKAETYLTLLHAGIPFYPDVNLTSSVITAKLVPSVCEAFLFFTLPEKLRNWARRPRRLGTPAAWAS